MNRREISLRHIDCAGRGLEIGPSYSPLVPKSSGARVAIVDHAERSDLVKKYRSWGVDEHSLACIEDVDYVWRGGSLLNVVSKPWAFDYVVASHLIEHTVDLIGFLQDCEALLGDEGRLALVIPDKRYCFDRFQPLSSVGGVIDAHYAPSAFHPAGTLVDHQAYACKRGDEAVAWGYGDPSPLNLQFPNLEGAAEMMEMGLRQEEYQDIHRWRFVPASFRLLIHDLRVLGFHSLGVVGEHDTMGHEFFVTLGKGVPPHEADRLLTLLEIEKALTVLGDSRAEDGGSRGVTVLEFENRALRAALRSILAMRSWRITQQLRDLASLRRSRRRRVT